MLFTANIEQLASTCIQVNPYQTNTKTKYSKITPYMTMLNIAGYWLFHFSLYRRMNHRNECTRIASKNTANGVTKNMACSHLLSKSLKRSPCSSTGISDKLLIDSIIIKNTKVSTEYASFELLLFARLLNVISELNYILQISIIKLLHLSDKNTSAPDSANIIFH